MYGVRNEERREKGEMEERKKNCGGGSCFLKFMLLHYLQLQKNLSTKMKLPRKRLGYVTRILITIINNIININRWLIICM